ncbi:thiol reductant ABC exporter subunit CydD [Subtercola sp. YIM 133946]|uniref:thiol reductant ABC exporter subunit CydD n=1 Tax=Subtercola sp. YIM 133946 TaxID=3118909 RepID=UPI002F91FBF2
MKPVDRRLLRYAGAARAFFAVGAVLALGQVACIVAFAWLVNSVVVRAIGGAGLGELLPSLAALAGVVLARSALAWLTEVNAARGAAIVKSQLRREVLAALPWLGPSWLATRNSVAITTVITSGLDALDTYFAKYLPQLILTVVVMPVLVVVLFLADWQSGLTVLLTLPLIPVFMVLIGRATEKAQADQWQQLSRLATGFLDVVEGLSTLKVFGREKRQAARIRSVTDEYRSTTMKVLRLSFLSGFALELAASLSVALVAVSIGLRLVDGSLALGVGLFVLMLAPEAFLPLRQVGAQFHAAADGVAATDDVFEILDAVPSAGPAAPAVAAESAAGPAAGVTVVLDAVTVRHGDDVAVDAFCGVFPGGALTVVSGPSGAGKSSLVAAMLGFVPFSGAITTSSRNAAGVTAPGGAEVAAGAAKVATGASGLATGPTGASGAATAVATGAERRLSLDDIAWAGQRPGLLAATIADNITLGTAAPAPALVERAMRLAAADDLDPATLLGVNGWGLSGGQAQRVAVARAFYRALERHCPVVVLDEPSSALDAATEGRLIAGLRELAAAGTTVVVVSHRPAVVAAAGHRVTLARPLSSASQPAAAAEPAAAGDQAAVTRGSVAAREPVATREPAATREPVVPREPAATREPVAPREPVTTAEPVAADREAVR